MLPEQAADAAARSGVGTRRCCEMKEVQLHADGGQQEHVHRGCQAYCSVENDGIEVCNGHAVRNSTMGKSPGWSASTSGIGCGFLYAIGMALTMCLIPCLMFYVGGSSARRMRTRGKRQCGIALKANDRAGREKIRQERIRNVRARACLISCRQRARAALSHLHRRRWPRHWRCRRSPGKGLKQNSRRVPCGVGQHSIVMHGATQSLDYQSPPRECARRLSVLREMPSRMYRSLCPHWRWLMRIFAVMIALLAFSRCDTNTLSSEIGCLGSESEDSLAEMSDSDDDSQSWHPRKRGVWRAMDLPPAQSDGADPTASSSAGVQAPPAAAEQPEAQSDETSDPEAANAAQLEEWFASRTQEQLEEMCKTYQVPEATLKPYQARASRAHEKPGKLSDQVKPRVRLLLLGSNFGQPQEETGMGRPDVQSS